MNSRRKVQSGAFALGLISLVTSGCAAGISNNPHGLGAGQWSVELPTAKSYSQGLAYGRGGSGARVQTDSDAPLFAEAHIAPMVAEEASKKTAHKKRRAEPVAPVTNAPVTPTQEQPAPVVPPAARHERTELASADTTSTLGRYEQRQEQSKSQQAFAGGDAIVIGASTLVIVILIVLLVLLLV